MKSEQVSTKQERIAENARRLPTVSFTSLAYHIDLTWLQESYRRTRKDGAIGVDGVSAAAYEKELAKNLTGLLGRFKAGTYVAPPVRRVYIPKEDGSKRPLGIPSLEDKILQRAVLMVLESIYEVDFLPCSNGFRTGRSVHKVLEEMWHEVMDMGGCWVLEADIRKYFDSMNHAHLREILSRRVNDGVIQRTVGKWLNAGVMEDGVVTYPEEGAPQGGVITPILSNIYLHEVLDLWFEEEVKPRLRGRARLIRFADDCHFVQGRARCAAGLRGAGEAIRSVQPEAA